MEGEVTMWLTYVAATFIGGAGFGWLAAWQAANRHYAKVRLTK